MKIYYNYLRLKKLRYRIMFPIKIKLSRSFIESGQFIINKYQDDELGMAIMFDPKQKMILSSSCVVDRKVEFLLGTKSHFLMSLDEFVEPEELNSKETIYLDCVLPIVTSDKPGIELDKFNISLVNDGYIWGIASKDWEDVLDSFIVINNSKYLGMLRKIKDFVSDKPYCKSISSFLLNNYIEYD